MICVHTTGKKRELELTNGPHTCIHIELSMLTMIALEHTLHFTYSLMHNINESFITEGEKNSWKFHKNERKKPKSNDNVSMTTSSIEFESSNRILCRRDNVVKIKNHALNVDSSTTTNIHKRTANYFYVSAHCPLTFKKNRKRFTLFPDSRSENFIVYYLRVMFTFRILQNYFFNDSIRIQSGKTI